MLSRTSSATPHRPEIWRRAMCLLVLVALFAAAPGGDNVNSETRTPTDTDEQGVSEEPIKIGFIASQSGVGAALGQTELRAAELFTERVNSAGGVLGRPVELITADDQSRADVAVTELRRIVSEGVVAVVGPSITPTMLAVIPVIKEAGLPTIFMTPSDYPNVNREPLLFSPVLVSLEQGMGALFDHWADSGVERLGLVLGNDAVGDSFEDIARDFEGSHEISLEVTRVPLDSSDYTSVLASLRDAGVDAVFTGMTGPPSAIVRRNQVQLGWDVPMYSTTGSIGSAFLELLGPDAEGMRWYSTPPPVVNDLPDGEQKQLIQEVYGAYEERYGEPPNYLAVGFANDALLSVVMAIETAAGAEPAAIRDALETQEVVGTNGIAHRSPTDHRGTSEEDVYIIEWRDGAYHLLD